MNPKTVMGQSKRSASGSSRRSAIATTSTRFVAVRFGNVLGSSGSVIPIFRRQIERGGPVTVTHPEMTRYFMTIPEAVPLVLQAGAIGGRGAGVRARHGRAGADRRPRAEHDPAVRARSPTRTSRSSSSARGPARSCTRSSGGEGEDVARPRTRRSAARRPAIDAAWLDAELAELERMVEAGETLEVVGRLAAIARAPRRLGVAEVGAAATATPTSETV